MISKKDSALSFRPGWKWRTARIFTQTLTLIALFLGPFLGGWQRMDRNNLSAWNGRGWDLPAPVMKQLPMGVQPSRAYELNQILGGGSGASFLFVPVADPVAGSVALMTGQLSARFLIAWLLPIFLALFAGRVFCGWFCPFGILSRILLSLRRRVPSLPVYPIPERRGLRWVVLAATLGAGFLTSWSFLYLSLPYILVQQSTYALWLLGGGGAALGMLGGLLLAGTIFGPTVYCATICPTGGALALLGFRRMLRVGLVEPTRCGTHCDLCDRACWLALKPSTGETGPDCDSCARCFTACPQDNMRLRFDFRPKLVEKGGRWCGLCFYSWGWVWQLLRPLLKRIKLCFISQA